MTQTGSASLARRPASVAIYVLSALALAWLVGGQMAFGRIDAALAIPLLMPGALALAWRLRGEAAPRRNITVLIAIAALLGAQSLLHISFGQRWGAGQALATALAGYLACRVAGGLVHHMGGRPPLLRWPMILLVTLLWFGAGQMFLSQAYGAPAFGTKPKLAILTGLPLRWAGGGDLSAMLAAGPSDAPALRALAQNFDVRLIDSVDEPAYDEALLVAHPRALTPEDMVRLDRRARGGARIVILADALSTWPPAYPLGDPRNPPVTSLLTPLLDHWGITLAAPAANRAGEEVIFVDPEGQKLRLHSAGRFTHLPNRCRSFGDRRVARCRLSSDDRAVWLVGDADMLHASLWQPMLSLAPWLPRSDNMSWLASVLQTNDGAGWFKPIWIR